MSNRSRIWVSSSIYGKAFLAKAWDARGELLEYERRGFAQFFYLTLCGHFESVLMNRIKARLRFVHTSPWQLVGSIKWTIEATEHICSLEPVVASVRHMASRLTEEVENAPLTKLTSVFGTVFPESLRTVLGHELLNDINALAALRNIFAHGRDLVMEFEGEDLSSLRGNLDDNPLKFPAQRLQAAGVIDSFDITGSNHHAFMSNFFSDAAMLHFYRAVRSAEEKINSFGSFIPEEMWFDTPPLPELRA